MPTVKSTKKGASGPKRNPKQATPYNKAQKGSGLTSKPKVPPTNFSKPSQARNKQKNSDLTSELDSLLGDLNSQLNRKKTKGDTRIQSGRTGSISAPEKALNEAQSKYEALQDDMMSALEGISALGK